MQLQIDPDADPERLYTGPELAKLWGKSLSYVNNMRAAGYLGYVDLAGQGKRVQPRYPASEVRRFREARTVPARISA